MKNDDVSERGFNGSDDPEYLAGILAALTTGVITTDEQFVIRWFNRSAADLLPELELGLTVFDLFAQFTHEEKADRLLLRRERVVVKPGDDRLAVEWLRSRRRLPDGGHLLLAWPAVLTDELTERRAEFTMAAFHELRTPLTALKGFAELLELDRGTLGPEQREAVAMITRTVDQLTRLTDDIHDLALNSFGELRLSREETDLAPLIAATVDAGRPQAAESGQEIRLEIEPDLPRIEVDPARIRQVTGNLIANACIHNPPGTTIDVGLRRAEGGLELTVSDDGAGLGFDPPDLAFQSFFRPEPQPDSKQPGAGIGLPLSKRLIELHRGRIELSGPGGRGTRVRIWLPLARETAVGFGRPGPV